MKKPMRLVFGEALRDIGHENARVVVLDADVSSSTQTRLFGDAFPDRFYNFGIAEMNMTAAAAGFAVCGDIPVVSTFAFLLSLRAGDAVRSLIAYNALNVKLAGAYAGLSDFADGASHQSVIDISIMRAMPNMTVLVPSDVDTAQGAVHAMMDINGPVYLRLSRAEVGSLHGGNTTFDIGKARLMRDGEDVLICACGTVLEAASAAADKAAGDGVSCRVLEFPTIKPFDARALTEGAKGVRHIVTVEENSVIGGLGSAVAETLSEAGCGVRVIKHGIRDSFGESGAYDLLLKKHGLDADSIYNSILNSESSMGRIEKGKQKIR